MKNIKKAFTTVLLVCVLLTTNQRIIVRAAETEEPSNRVPVYGQTLEYGCIVPVEVELGINQLELKGEDLTQNWGYWVEFTAPEYGNYTLTFSNAEYAAYDEENVLDSLADVGVFTYLDDFFNISVGFEQDLVFGLLDHRYLPDIKTYIGTLFDVTEKKQADHLYKALKDKMKENGNFSKKTITLCLEEGQSIYLAFVPNDAPNTMVSSGTVKLEIAVCGASA